LLESPSGDVARDLLNKLRKKNASQSTFTSEGLSFKKNLLKITSETTLLESEWLNAEKLSLLLMKLLHRRSRVWTFSDQLQNAVSSLQVVQGKVECQH